MLGGLRGLAAPWRSSNRLSGGRIVQTCFSVRLNTQGEGAVSNDPESPSVLERDSLTRGRGYRPVGASGKSMNLTSIVQPGKSL